MSSAGQALHAEDTQTPVKARIRVLTWKGIDFCWGTGIHEVQGDHNDKGSEGGETLVQLNQSHDCFRRMFTKFV